MEVLNVKIDYNLNKGEIIARIVKKIDKGRYCLVTTVNAEFIVDAWRNPKFRQILNNACISLPDGIGILFAMKYLEVINKYNKSFFFPMRAFIYGIYLGLNSFINKEIIRGRVSGRELIYEMCSIAEQKKYSVFLLGGWKKDRFGRMKKTHGDIAGLAAKKLTEMYPNLVIVGATSEFSYKDEDDAKTIEYIHKCKKEHSIEFIDMLFVAYNHIRQEAWIERNVQKIPARMCMGVGGSLDYIAGTYKVPNKIFVNLNLEWLYKLVMQPWRVRRIFKAFPIFPLLVYFSSIKSK